MTHRNDEVREKSLIVPHVTETEIQKISEWLENEMNLYSIVKKEEMIK